MLSEVKNIINIFFEKLDIHIDNLELIQQEENIYLIKIQTNESGLVIGPHGKNISIFENLFKTLLSKKMDKRVKLHMEVNDYQASKDERLHSFISSKVSYVQKTGKDVMLPFYEAYERKKIHGYVSDINDPNIYTKSIGEEKERRLYICKKDEKLTIDIDGNDI